MSRDGTVTPVAETTTTDLAVRALLAPQLGGRAIVGIQRRPSLSRSSVMLHEIDVVLDDGTTLALMGKAIDWRALAPDAQRAKPLHLWDETRELAAYTSILSAVDVGAARFFGSFQDESGSRCLLLERIDGVPLWQFGDFEAWREAARWLARMHRRLNAADVAATPAADRLVIYDRRFYQSWMGRAIRFAHDARPALAELTRHHREIVDYLLAQPAAFIHGEFYSANVLVARPNDGAYLVRPIDWEMAALATASIDLACLASGSWTDIERADLADAYHDEFAALGGARPPRDGYLRTLDACLIHLSVQNLGFSAAWTPPPDRRHDWLGEALRLCEKWQ